MSKEDVWIKDCLKVVVVRNLRNKFTKRVVNACPNAVFERLRGQGFITVHCYMSDIEKIQRLCEERNFQWFLGENYESPYLDMPCENKLSIWVPYNANEKYFLNLFALRDCEAYKVPGSNWYDISGTVLGVHLLTKHCKHHGLIFQTCSAMRALCVNFPEQAIDTA